MLVELLSAPEPNKSIATKLKSAFVKKLRVSAVLEQISSDKHVASKKINTSLIIFQLSHLFKN